MELLSILLSALIGIVSPTGLVLDQVVEDVLRGRFNRVEQLEVRVDQATTLQTLQGQVNKIRIAGRGLYPIPEFRIAVLDIETDPIDINIGSLRQGLPQLDEPLQGGVNLVLTEADINRLLQSPRITERIRNFGINLLSAPQAIQAQQYSLINPRVTFLEGDRLRAEFSIQDQQSLEQLDLQVESGLALVTPYQLQLVEPTVLVNGQPAPSQLVNKLSEGVSQRLDLRSLQDGISVRLLQLEVEAQSLQAAAFVRVEPTVLSSGK